MTPLTTKSLASSLKFATKSVADYGFEFPLKIAIKKGFEK